jgi:cell division protein FtsL
VVGLLIAAVAGVQAVIAQSSFRMDDLTHQAQQLQQRNGELRLQIAELGSPKHLEQAARRLGLREPDAANVRVLTVKSGASGGHPQAGAAATGPAMAAGGVP